MYKILPDLSVYDPDPADGVRVGEKAVSGLTLRRILRRHTGWIGSIAWSPDGRFVASASSDKTIRIWDVASGDCRTMFEGHEAAVYCVAWSPDGHTLASGSLDGTVRFWDTTGNSIHTVSLDDDAQVRYVSWSPDGNMLASATSHRDHTAVRLWDAHNGKLIKAFKEHKYHIHSVLWSADGQILASCDNIGNIFLWNREENGKYAELQGHQKQPVYSLSWCFERQIIASASHDHTVRIWDAERKIETSVLEAHTEFVTNVAFSNEGALLASKGFDKMVLLWRTDNWQIVARLAETTHDFPSSLAFHPHLPILATLGEKDTVIRIWDLDMEVLLGQTAGQSIRYTTAKVVLVGDSGVGKTGLGWRLAHGRFSEHTSTHGQQFWVIDQLGQIRPDGTECEAVLWDLAGQPDYRLVHSLFLDDVDTALVVFDPTNRQEPLSSVDFWLNQLRNKEQALCNSILVGARTDRGTSTLTVEELQAYCERNGISGGYIPTSALSGAGLPELLERVRANIAWDEMTATVTTLTFKRIKEYVLALKERAERTNVLVQPTVLRSELQATDSEWKFSDAEMMTAVGHLATHGYVTVLRGTQAAQSILLAPNVLANLASSIVLEARRNPRGLGVLEEGRLLAGGYAFPELHDLDGQERGILLDAAAVLFLEHNLCFRETFNQQTFLVFPSLINEKRPKDEDLAAVEAASYRVKGAVENVYASLVVLLGYTNTFIRTHQWQNQAQYEMGDHEICGFKQTSYRDGEIELVIYFADHTPEPVRLTFRGLFERFLSRGEFQISRYQTVHCSKCGGQLARNVVMSQLAKNKDFSFCSECGDKLSLPSPEPITRLPRREELVVDAQQAVAERRTAFETALVRVKALLRDRAEAETPTCFISYAWGVPEHERWVLNLAKDLRNAGIDVLLDRWHSPPGSNLDLFIERILSSDFVLPVGTPALRQKYDTQKTDPIVAAELKLINLRVRQPTSYGDNVLPVLLAGEAQTSLAPQLQPLVCVDFREERFYFRKLFDMICRIYSLPLDDALLEELQVSMSP